MMGGGGWLEGRRGREDGEREEVEMHNTHERGCVCVGGLHVESEDKGIKEINIY